MEPVRQELLLSAAGAWGACCSNLVSCRVMLRAERARAWNLFAGKWLVAALVARLGAGGWLCTVVVLKSREIRAPSRFYRYN